MAVKILIINGDGINADEELAQAFRTNETIVRKVSINDLLINPKQIHDYQIIGFPGGFSFGDEIRSGLVFALKIAKIKSEFIEFIQNKKLIIGICNGLQILVQMELFNGISEEKDFTLSMNDHGQFRNFWTEVCVLKNNSPWLCNIDKSFYLPVRHKEGRIYGSLTQAIPVLKYASNVNGSLDNIAGVTDKSGLIFGLMPHPEAATSSLITPIDLPINNFKICQQIFSNAILYAKKELV